MKNQIIIFLCLATLFLRAQTDPLVKSRCGTGVPDQAWNDWFNAKVEEFKKANVGAKELTANYTIPVIFHVIHGGQSVGTFPNVSQLQINSQVKILNDDYAGSGYNVANFANTNFAQSLIANCNISFCLAEKDPNGVTLSEKGIERVSYVAKGWSDPASFTVNTNFKNFIDNTVKPGTIWDPSRYLNIWISDVNSSVGLLGYATFPAGSTLSGMNNALGTATDDGVWCWTKAIGDVGTLTSSYDKGRTATHEVGHWLGLRHIWGDGSCASDFCNDTPTQQQANTGCPTYPSVSCSNGPNGDMFMNFMDYSYDYCLYMFSNDQRTRMQTAMANAPYRKNLSASAATLCTNSPAPCSYSISNFSNSDSLFSYRRATASASDVGCAQGQGKAGYITGTNCYGDKEKAEFISSAKYSSATNPVVTGVIVLFFQYGNLGTDGSGNAGLNIYAGTSVASQPGALLGSVTENMATIAATTNTNGVGYCGNPNLSFNIPLIMPYKFNLPTPVSVPQSGGFFASVVLPTTAGDTISIIDKATGVTNTAWEKWDDNTWHDMKTAWGSSRNYNLAIIPVIECGPVGISERSLFEKSIDLFPNPSSGNFNILTNLVSVQTIEITVYNVLGQQVYHNTLNDAKQNLIEVDMRNESSGIYFVQISNGQEKAVKRLVLNR